MKSPKLLLPLIALVITLPPGSVPAQPRMHGAGPDSSKASQRNFRMFAGLNLTDDQQTKLKALHDEMMTIRKKHMEAVKTVRDKMKTELLKSDASQNTLYGYAGELGELHKQMTKDRTDHLLKVKKVLTPEQFSKLVEKEERMGRGGFDHKRPGRCPRGGNCPKKGDCPYRGSDMKRGNCPYMGGSGQETENPQ